MALGKVVTFKVIPEAWSTEVTDKLDFIKIKNFCSTKTMSREWENKSQTGRKTSANTYLTKGYYPKYTKNY